MVRAGLPGPEAITGTPGTPLSLGTEKGRGVIPKERRGSETDGRVQHAQVSRFL